MKILFHQNWRKLVIAVLLLNLPFFIHAQQFLTALPQPEIEPTERQQQRLVHLEQNPMNKRVTLVSVGNLRTLQDRGVLPLAIPGRNDLLTAHAISVQATSDTDYVWYGEFRGRRHGYATIIAKNGATYGQINVENDIYTLRDLGNGMNALVEKDPSKYGQHECATPHNEVEGKPNEGTFDEELKHHCNSNVRVLVLFTQAAEQAGDPENDANLFITQTNQILRNSGVSFHDLNFELVGVERHPLIAQVETPDDILFDLQIFRAATDDLRDELEADLVITLTDGDYFNNNVFGAAYLEEVGDENFGYAICEIDAAGGRFTFAHEIAHLLGARHDDDTTPGFAHERNFLTGWWPFRKERRTILASLDPDSDESRIQHYSNPDVDFKRRATGVENQRDNARQLIDLACDVADYRDTPDPMSVSISGPIKGDNSGTYTWCANVNNCDNVASYNWEYSYDGFTYYPFSTDECRTGQLPFDRDLFLRVTATCTDGQASTAWHTVLNQDGGFFDPVLIVENNDNTQNEIQKTEVRQEVKIELFPNPSAENIFITAELPNDGLTNVELLDINGVSIESIASDYRESGLHYFNTNISNYQSGVYILRIEQNGYIFNAKVFIK